MANPNVRACVCPNSDQPICNCHKATSQGPCSDCQHDRVCHVFENEKK